MFPPLLETELLLHGGIIYPMLPIYVKKNCKDLSGKHQPHIHDAPFHPNIHSCRHPAHPHIRIEVISANQRYFANTLFNHHLPKRCFIALPVSLCSVRTAPDFSILCL